MGEKGREQKVVDALENVAICVVDLLVRQFQVLQETNLRIESI
jgi:hypothetical protein